MRKNFIKSLVLMTLISSTVLCQTTVFASASTNQKINTTTTKISTKDNLDKNKDDKSIKQIKDVKELHNYVIKNFNKNIKNNFDGTITISDLNKIIDGSNLKDKYIEWLNDTNFCVQKGALKFDENYQIEVVPFDERPVEKKRSKRSTDGGAYEYEFNLNDTVWENGQYMKKLSNSLITKLGGPAGRVAVYAEFARKVRGGGDWDYKEDLGLTTKYSCAIGSQVFFLTGEQIGNINYGYTGKAASIPDFNLKSAAGLIQILSDTSDWSYWDSYFDQPTDQAEIQRGINWYNTGRFR